jgi:hypothetical protein
MINLIRSIDTLNIINKNLLNFSINDSITSGKSLLDIGVSHFYIIENVKYKDYGPCYLIFPSVIPNSEKATIIKKFFTKIEAIPPYVVYKDDCMIIYDIVDGGSKIGSEIWDINTIFYTNTWALIGTLLNGRLAFSRDEKQIYLNTQVQNFKPKIRHDILLALKDVENSNAIKVILLPTDCFLACVINLFKRIEPLNHISLRTLQDSYKYIALGVNTESSIKLLFAVSNNDIAQKLEKGIVLFGNIFISNHVKINNLNNNNTLISNSWIEKQWIIFYQKLSPKIQNNNLVITIDNNFLCNLKSNDG